MTTQELTIEQIRIIYHQHVVEDFPDDERKPLDRIEQALRDGKYKCVGAFDEEGALLGYAFFVFEEKKCLLDYYAVVPKMRGKGVGTAFLKQAVELSGAEMMVIEVEDPEVGDREEREKRLRFYLNAGCVDTGVKARCFGVEFLILEYPIGKVHGAEEIRVTYETIYRAILPRTMFDSNIVISV